MTLSPGHRLGAYEIVGLLGSGGMGEVYRARDTRLDRDVAIKILQGSLALQPEVRQRFEREARIVSSLNHPNICTLYDVGHQDDLDYIVMERLDGETLAERLARGPLPVEEVLRTGIQIADALDRAHRQGLVHRDLKPGNIMLTKSGAKLLDFGLARATGLGPSAGDVSSPTMSRPLTAEGAIVGTFQYMAPEQLEGREADARSDLFSFGSVLYEMAVGRRAFEGRSQASLIASILKETPRPISSAVALAPPALDRAVMRCLEKDPDDRWQTARDLLLELKWVAEAGSRAGVPAPVAARRKSRERLAWGIASVAAAGALGLAALLIARTPPKPEPVRFVFETPSSIRSIGTPKVSPDGRCVAFNAVDSTGVSRIWVRRLSATSLEPLAGTEGSARPFWSADSRFLGFMADGKLKRIAVSGGPPQTVCEAGAPGDGSWGPSGIILFDGTPIDSVRRVSAAGGDPSAATVIDRAAGEVGTAWPQFLPDGRHFLYLGLKLKQDETVLKVGDLKSPKTTVLLKGDLSRIEYVEPGYVLFVRDRALLAQRFDTKRMKFSGDPFPIVEDVAAGGGVASNADFSGSNTGTIAFRGGVGGDLSRLAWVDRAGRVLREFGEFGDYPAIAAGPDGRRVAVEMGGGSPDIWILDSARDARTRLTFDPAADYQPIWSPDGTRIAFGSDRAGVPSVYVKPVSGAGADSLVCAIGTEIDAADWSRDGRYLACTVPAAATRGDIWIVPLAAGQKPYPFIAGPFAEWEPRFSPDGRWLAYTSNESGRREVYIQPFPGRGGKWQVSTQGGRNPEWRGDGRELYFISATGAMMAVDVSAAGTLDLGIPHVLFQPVLARPRPTGQNYSVSADGQRFLVRKSPDVQHLPATSVFLNWTAAIPKP